MPQAQYCWFRQTHRHIVLAIAVFVFGLDIVLLSAINILNSVNHLVWGFEHGNYRYSPAVWKSHQNLNIFTPFFLLYKFFLQLWCHFTFTWTGICYIESLFSLFACFSLIFPLVISLTVFDGKWWYFYSTRARGRNAALLNVDTARFFVLYHILHFKWQSLHFQTFGQICSVCPVLTPILCSCGVRGALFTIHCNICVTGHFWELAPYVILGYS